MGEVFNIVLGTICIILSLYPLVLRLGIRSHGMYTEAKVVAIQRRWELRPWKFWRTRRLLRPGRYYCPVLFYQVDGIFYQEDCLDEATSTEKSQLCQEGDVVAIMYHPDDPEKMYIAGSPVLTIWQIVGVLAGVGLILFSLAGRI